MFHSVEGLLFAKVCKKFAIHCVLLAQTPDHLACLLLLYSE